MSTCILAFDSSGPLLDLACLCGTEIVSKTLEVGRGHGEAIGPVVQELLDEAHASVTDLSTIVVPRGPGSFTGLRIAISFAKGLQAAIGVPVFAADTLRAMTRSFADGPAPPKAVAALIDGRKRRFYAALDEVLHDGTLRRVFGPVDEDAATIHSRLERYCLSVGIAAGRHEGGHGLMLVGDAVPGKDWVSFPQPRAASGVARALIALYQHNDPLLYRLGETEGPDYFRVSQAEEASL